MTELARITRSHSGQAYAHHQRCGLQTYLFVFRWFRSPCCGRVFPCDVCHDEASDHPMEVSTRQRASRLYCVVHALSSLQWATRMVCGRCSSEQPFSNSPCSKCGFDFARGHSSKHWEGGKGKQQPVVVGFAQNASGLYIGVLAGCRDSRKMSSKDDKKFRNMNKTVSRKAKSKK